MAKKILPSEAGVSAVREILESLNEPANTPYYVFFSDHTPGNSTPADINDSPRETIHDVYRKMIFGKRVGLNDAAHGIRYVPYAPGVVYAMYDDLDQDLYTKDYYAVVDAGSWHHVWKCLDNNNGANSTVAPDLSDLDPTDEVYESGDGYHWKYICSTSAAQKLRLATTTTFPVFANTTVAESAIHGGLDIIKVDNAGAGYKNYITGTFAGADIRVNGQPDLYALSSTAASALDGFYTGCVIYLSAGVGVGQYREVIHYFLTGGGRFIQIDEPFDVSPVNGTEFQIYPQVRIVGHAQTSNAVARALVNAVGNGVYRVEMLNRGNDYHYATASVVANVVVGVETLAEVRPILTPPGGHGADAYGELAASRFLIGVKVSNNESNTVPAVNSFRQIGLLTTPLFANVEIELANSEGTFLTAERVLKVEPIRLATNATTNSMVADIVCATADFEHQLDVGDLVYFKDVEAERFQVAAVASVVNSSQFALVSNALFSCTEVSIYLANESTEAYVGNLVSASIIRLANVAGTLAINDEVVGLSSGARAVVNSVSMNGVQKGFNTYTQLHRYELLPVSGSFEQDEKVYHGNTLSVSSANAWVHSTKDNGGTFFLYVSEAEGNFDSFHQFKGSNSEATADWVDSFPPELVYGSGRIVYVENVDEVERAADQSDIVKVVMKF